MKTFLILIFLSVCALPVSSQSMVAGVQAELMITGPQYGGTLAYETSKQWGYGGFYQTGMEKRSETNFRSTFYGALIQAPLVRTKKLSLFINVRGGIVNKQFAVIAPGLETRISFGNRFSLGIGASMRMNYPSLSSKLIVTLF